MLRASAFLALAGSLVACGSQSSATGAAHPDASTSSEPDASDDAASTSDAAPLDAGAPDVNALQLLIEPDQGMTPVYDFISTAKKTLDLTLYELDDDTATGLLTTAAANGVAVRVILDQALEGDTNMTAYNALTAAKAQVHWANPVFQASHQKTITVDGKTSAIMTLNFASSDYKTSRDFAVITNDAANVAAIETVFEADFKNASITPPTADGLVWSPTNSLSALQGIIGGAKKTLLVENEEMGDQPIVTALSNAAGRGVDVEVVMESSRSYATQFSALQAAGVKVNVYSRQNPLYIHAKVILADYGTSAASVFIGSENFSNPSLTENRELGIITSDPGVMAQIQTTLAKDFSGGTTFRPYDAGAPDAGRVDAGAVADAAVEDAAVGEDAGGGEDGGGD